MDSKQRRRMRRAAARAHLDTPGLVKLPAVSPMSEPERSGWRGWWKRAREIDEEINAAASMVGKLVVLIGFVAGPLAVLIAAISGVNTGVIAGILIAALAMCSLFAAWIWITPKGKRTLAPIAGTVWLLGLLALSAFLVAGYRLPWSIGAARFSFLSDSLVLHSQSSSIHTSIANLHFRNDNDAPVYDVSLEALVAPIGNITDCGKIESETRGKVDPGLDFTLKIPLHALAADKFIMVVQLFYADSPNGERRAAEGEWSFVTRPGDSKLAIPDAIDADALMAIRSRCPKKQPVGKRYE